MIRSPRTELPRNPRKIPEYFEKQIFSLELGFIHGAPIWLNNAVCAICRITALACLKPRFHSPHLHQSQKRRTPFRKERVRAYMQI
nr:MAG TPA: hypothetical protein [Caudoviricetes sp.]